MSSCVEVIVRRVGEIRAKAESIGSMSCSAVAIGEARTKATEIADILVRTSPIADYIVRVGLVCSTNLNDEYGIIWASDGKLITIEGGYLIQA